MFLSYVMLIVALCLSAVAAFYSIVGLTAIFAAAVIPIIVMGSILEVAKVTVTIWLHEYWSQCRLAMKTYLVPAVGLLMLITSMGIFGFLSKAHTDQGLVSSDSQANISIYDEKIRTSRDNIEANRRALKQMDEAVDQVMGRSSDEKGADKAVAIRRSQQKERARLLTEISTEQKTIARLNEEAAPFRAENRKIEAEVGPIKYIAALIYGDNPDANILERAVRWVIIIIVAVFDPLAIMMLLAATESMKWERTLRDQKRQEEHDNDRPGLNADIIQPMVAPPDPGTQDINQSPDSATTVADESDTGDSVPVRSEWNVDQYQIEHDRLAGLDNIEYMDWYVEADPTPPVQPDEQAQMELDLELSEADSDVDTEKAAIREWKRAHPESTIKQQRRLYEKGDIDQVPWQQTLALVADNEQHGNNVTGFGIDFPSNPNKGDMFLRVDILPTVLYKHNGKKWIEIDKDLSDSYTYDEAYIDYLIAKLTSGEYDAELLTYAEREQIAHRLEQSH